MIFAGRSLGRMVGQRVIPVFLVLLVGMLVAAAASFMVFHRYGGRFEKSLRAAGAEGSVG